MAAYVPEHIGNPELGCLAARHSNSNNLVGAVILEFMKTTKEDEEDSDMNHDDPNILFAFRAIDGIMKECKHIFKREMTHRHNRLGSKCGYVAWIAVDESVRGAGIAGELIQRSSTLLTDSGCHYAVAFTVSPTATRVFERNGYVRWGSVTYKVYEIDGKYPFRILPDEVSVYTAKKVQLGLVGSWPKDEEVAYQV